MIRILRRKFATPLGLLITVVFVWYSVVMLEGMFSPVREQSVDSYDLRVHEAMMEIKDQRNARKTAELLQSPDNENSILERRAEFDTNNENDQVNINNFENLEEIELKEEQNHHQNLVYEADVNEQVNENLNDLEIKLDSNDGDRDEEKEKLQINPPLKDLPKINLPIKEGIGENGEPVHINKTELNEEDLAEYNEGYKNNAFNEYLSNRISLDRTLKDPRDDKCKLIKYSDNLPDVSVIVTFHNEAWSVLLRSVHSIINRTPDHLLREIILTDDCSNMPHLLEPLETYLLDFPKVKVVRAETREGLIRARLRGYRAATGSVLVFLDSHIECAEGWIEPMLDRIAQNWTTVVTPVIDVINDDTFGFQFQDAKGTNVGGFDWNLVFTWHGIPAEERKRRDYEDHLPVRSPTMAGGLFAISRKYFEYIGTYDDGMDIWGGENLEMSFRIWMCGGTLETTPCSHVGHIFRKRSPYKWRTGVNVVLKNNVRLAEVWLDDYKYYYYERIGNVLGEYGNVSSRIELRKRLQCKSFEWFLKYVYPEMWVPGESVAYGQIKAKTGSYCLSGSSDYGNVGKPIMLKPCSKTWDMWYLSLAKEIRRDNNCFDFSNDGPDVKSEGCHNLGGNQEWEYRVDNTLFHVRTGKCLEISPDGTKAFMNTCLGTDYQIWEWNRGPPKGPTRNWNIVE